MRSALYIGEVMHHRLRPRRHRFVYRTFSLLLDLDELPALARRLRLFAHNKAGLLSFHDKDHGAADGSSPRAWAEAALVRAGLGDAAKRVDVLCFPRILGYAFNPLTLYFCRRADGRIGAMIYAVRNTFGERHAYLLPVDPDEAARGLIRQSCAKSFYVSPFIAMQAGYEFTLKPPGAEFALAIRETDAEGDLLLASQTARRVTLTDRTLAGALASHPLMALKVIGGIHWEALRLWLKGVPLQERPVPPPIQVSTPPPLSVSPVARAAASD
jgi:DUF1365 family protein